ncbi:MAG: hypothetical protein CBB89_05960 [Rhizobiales bacterium TMED29]|nr:MAG: hypothetical protein CBB89_05960 [Rhizobiales bacterium TMED29]
MQMTYETFNPNEVEKFKDDVQTFILKQDLKNIKILKATKGILAIVDKDMTDFIDRHKWYGLPTNSGVYAVANIGGKRQYLQNYIWEKKTGKKQKHITFHNKLTVDCRFHNLLGTSRLAVMCNRRGKSGTTSQFKGVSFEEKSELWRVAIQIKGIRYSFGRYKNEQKAALVYDAGARILMGKMAFQNFRGSRINKEADEIAKKYIESRRARMSSQSNV